MAADRTGVTARRNDAGRRPIIGAAVLVAAAMAASACAAGQGSTASNSAGGRTVGGTVASDAPARGGWDCPGGSCSWSQGGGGASAYGAADAKTIDSAVTAVAPEAASKAPGASTPSTRSATRSAGDAPLPQTGQSTLPLTAGSIDDNETWAEYLLYRQAFDKLGVKVDRIPIEARQVITVVDSAGRPVLGADVQIQDSNNVPVAQLRTYADGRALFHPLGFPDPSTQKLPSYTATITKGAARTQVTLTAEQRAYTATLDQVVPSTPVALDVLFLIDTTGSMGDEIDRLKANMDSISKQLTALPTQPDVRFAMTAYRDRGDLFVTRTFNFTSDHRQFAQAVSAVQADGGGDTPEDLNAGLADAITKPSWRGSDAVKLVFLIADAPPHLDYPDGVPYAASLAQAVSKGIKIMPIAASGLDNQGEYIFRQFAQLTMGRFVFLTYGADGQSPGGSTPHHVNKDEYSVLALDELVIKLVAAEVAKLR